jgi:leucine-rich repeat protein SHOC2
LALKPG